MKINDLIAEQQTDEGIGSALAAGARGLAKGAGAAVGGLAGMGSAFKQGYTGGKLAVAGGAPTAQASGGGASAGGNQSSIQQQIDQKQAEIAALKKQLGTPPVEPGIGQQQGKVAAVASNTPEPGQAGTEPVAKEPPPVEPGIGNQQGNVAAVASNTPDPSKLSPEQIRQQKQAAAAKVAQDQMAATPAWPPGVPKFNKHTGEKFTDPAQAKAFMASPEYKMDSDEYDQTQAAKTAPAPAPAANPNKPSPEQIKQAQLKKDLLQKKQARDAGQAAPSGFAASGVGAPRQRLYTKQGGDVGSYTVREGAEFYSRFLGKNI